MAPCLLLHGDGGALCCEVTRLCTSVRLYTSPRSGAGVFRQIKTSIVYRLKCIRNGTPLQSELLSAGCWGSGTCQNGWKIVFCLGASDVDFKRNCHLGISSIKLTWCYLGDGLGAQTRHSPGVHLFPVPRLTNTEIFPSPITQGALAGSQEMPIQTDLRTVCRGVQRAT